MTDLSGITVTSGVLPAQLRFSLAEAVERIGGKMVDTVRIDTTHFICIEGRGREWERAVEMNIPVVRPEWIEGCEREGRIVGVRGYYLNADPRLRQVGQGVNMGSQGQSRRTDSQTSIKRVPPASMQASESRTDASGLATSGTDVSNATPRSSTATTTNAKASATPEPPTPPAKDPRSRRGTDSMPASARTVPEVSPLHSPNTATGPSSAPQGESETESEDEEVEEEQHKHEAAKTPQGARSLVQSPFESVHKEAEAPHRTFGAEAERKREPSEGGSFSEVQL